jgi:rhodanese-related sulfurtransferase
MLIKRPFLMKESWKRRLRDGLSGLAIGLSWMPSMAQSTSPAAYQAMLRDLYRHTVPCVMPQALDSMARPYVLLDTRARAEYDVSHLPGARWVGYEAFDPKRVADLAHDQPILVYCSVGYRSERIGEQLLQLGFTRVENLYGGIFEWKHAGHAVVNQQEQPTERIHTYNQQWSQWLRTGEKVFDEVAADSSSRP